MRLPSLNIQVVTALVFAAGPMFAWSFNGTDAGKFASASARAAQVEWHTAERIDLSTATLEQAQGRLLLWTEGRSAGAGETTDAATGMSTDHQSHRGEQPRQVWTITPIALSPTRITSITSGPGTTDRVSVGVRATGTTGEDTVKVLTGERLALTYRSPREPVTVPSTGSNSNSSWKLSGYRAVSQRQQVASLRAAGDDSFTGEYDS